jgi:hypothetical protein
MPHYQNCETLASLEGVAYIDHEVTQWSAIVQELRYVLAANPRPAI